MQHDDVAAHEHQRLLEAALTIDQPRPGEDTAAMLRRVGVELRQHRERFARTYGTGAARKLIGGAP